MTTVRLATLQDTAAITAIHRSLTPQWERITAEGTRLPMSYESLTLFERWQHGGAWMSIETCAVHLNRLLAGSGIPLVAEENGVVVGMAELYESVEPPPFGSHLELSVLAVHADHQRRGVGSALMRYILQMGRLMRCAKVIVAHGEAAPFYTRMDFRQTLRGQSVRLPTVGGRVFYQAAEWGERSYEAVRGWALPLGRYRSSRQEWDKLFPQDWAAGMPELLNAQSHHVKLTAAGGQAAVLYSREADEIDCEAGDVHLACWSARPLTGQLVAALRDWAFRTGYKTILTFLMESELALIGSEAQPTGYRQDLYEVTL
ncbi:MAG TPA: GNAT family N-acetyltransferase [Aggregatilineales bacterium]|nr:GNAT family N-acetyltransferase [Anaerolineales bacterium]HRE48066.1 GNAT family N-acetyltransferase [Aggregatilineales bacterium]